jgi:hypothetical protein
MKAAIILLLCLVANTSASAQYTAKPEGTTGYSIAEPIPAVYNSPALPAPSEPTAGKLLQQSGTMKNLSLLAALAFGGLAAGLSTVEDTRPEAVTGLLVFGGVLSLGLNISGNCKQAKAGKLMQQQ